MAELSEGKLSIRPSLSIGLEELTWRYSASGGPGGQHANRSNTRVELVFDIEHSPSLGPRQKARLLERIGPVLRIVAADERSQLRNRELALERLRARLNEGLRVDKSRTPTRPTRASQERRLEEKRTHAERKRLRRVAPDD
jgi:ribosome-associated protein